MPAPKSINNADVAIISSTRVMDSYLALLAGPDSNEYWRQGFWERCAASRCTRQKGRLPFGVREVSVLRLTFTRNIVGGRQLVVGDFSHMAKT